MKPGEGHVLYADGMRVVAIIAVVVLHRSAIDVLQYGQIPSDQWWIANVIDSACRWVVPVFIMLSGCLNLSRTQQGDTLPFLIKRFKRVGIPLLFWAPIYFACHVVFEGRGPSLEFIVSSLADGLIINHLYFIFILLMLYLMTPLFDQLILRSGKTAVLIIAFLIFIPAASGMFSHTIPVNAATLFIPYIPYYLIGFLLRPYVPEKQIWISAILLYLMTSAVIAIQTGNLTVQYGIDDSRALAYYENVHPAVAVQAVCAWLILSRLFSMPISEKFSRALNFSGRASFGVYLTHILFLGLIHFYAGSIFDRNIAWGIFSDTVLALAGSVLLTSALIHASYLRAVVGEAEKRGPVG
jgi:surface polysaccharide O-acyltransferase-like enzyme